MTAICKPIIRQLPIGSDYADLLQIGSRTMQNFTLLEEVRMMIQLAAIASAMGRR